MSEFVRVSEEGGEVEEEKKGAAGGEEGTAEGGSSPGPGTAMAGGQSQEIHNN